jgi:putative PEP-CTERM system histidine kinase
VFLISFWSLVAVSLGYMALAVWCISIQKLHKGARHLAIAFFGMGLWAGSLVSSSLVAVTLGELTRDAAWIGYLHFTTKRYDQVNRQRHTTEIFLAILLGLAVLKSAVAIPLAGPASAPVMVTWVIASLVAHWAFALVGLFLTHFLFRAAANARRSGFRLIVASLGVMWAYNLNLFTLILLGYREAMLFSSLRGLVLLALLPAFALAARRKEQWRIGLSRQATTQSLLLTGLGSYFVVVASATRAVAWIGGYAADVSKLLLALSLVFASLVLALRPALRARIKIFIIKHVFEHRYDYRTEWLRFSATIGERSSSEATVEERAIRSIADVTESNSGVLLTCEGFDRLVLAGTWQRKVTERTARTDLASADWIEAVGQSGWILCFDEIRKSGPAKIEEEGLPNWLFEEPDAWVGVPLVRSSKLVGLVVLDRPIVERPLDWEDFDLLKVIAQQVAVHLTDAQHQGELAEARRFDEFNRRFAFIIHDLKNVVSQLALVSSNAAEHGANPKFQVAMANTLDNATGKMTAMLSRLSPSQILAGPEIRVVEPGQVLERLASEYEVRHQISVKVGDPCQIMADPDQLHEALGHLVANAIDASIDDTPIELSLSTDQDTAEIWVEDHGCGMSGEFIRNSLFRPFASTKDNGFGLGAAEARSRVRAMGGDLDVTSVIGKGTRFIIRFPLHSEATSNRI